MNIVFICLDIQSSQPAFGARMEIEGVQMIQTTHPARIEWWWAYFYKARTPFLPRLGLTVASTPALVSAPFCNAFLSAAAKAWLAAISCSRSIAGSAGTMGGPDLLWRWMLISLYVSIPTTRSLFGPHCHCGCNRGLDFLN
jgi:hypothetical protein